MVAPVRTRPFQLPEVNGVALAGTSAPPQPAPTNHWSAVAHSVVQGVELNVHRAQETPAMAMLHGLEDGWQSWGGMVDLLRGSYRCYAVDLPWRAAGSYNWRARGTAVQWVESALALLPEQPSVLVAHSMGASSVLQWLASGATPSFDAIVLLSPFYRLQTTPVDWRMFDRSLADFRTVMTEGMRAKLGERAASIEPDVFLSMADKMLDRIGPQGFLALFDMYISSSSLSLSHVDIPTLVLGGSKDPGISGPRAEALAADMPSAEIQIHPGFSHHCHAEQPHQVTEVVTEFLNRHIPAHA